LKIYLIVFVNRTHDYFKVIKVTSSTTTSEVIAKALSDFGLTNVTAEKYSLAEVLLISNVNYTDRILEPNEYPLNVLRQQRKVKHSTKKIFIECIFLSF
jgi:hypothetical protein